MKSWILVLCVASCAQGALAAVSTFDANAEGWTLNTFPGTDYTAATTPYGAPTWFATGGNPGGYVGGPDPDGGDSFMTAPAAFLGDQSAVYGTYLTYDLIDGAGNNYNAAAAVILKGGAGLTLTYYSSALPSTTDWTPFAIPLTESDWTYNGGGGVSASDFQSVLSSLTALYIRSEYQVGDDDMRFDNANFGTGVVPEPSLAVALAPLALRRRR